VWGGRLCPAAQEEENKKREGDRFVCLVLAKVGDCEQQLG